MPEDCKYWLLYILHLKICNIATSWQIKPDTISYLGILIEEHHTQFKSLYPDRAIIPKMHYMLHYPSQIVRYGPLIYAWTMRHEAKLSVIKRAARHGNFKNICHTIAKRSQHILCYHLNSGEPFLGKCVGTSNTFNECLLVNESEEIRCHIGSLDLVVHSVQHLSWIKCDILHLKKFSYVYLGNGEMYPMFGKVIDILATVSMSSNSLHIIHIQKCETLYFDSHYNAYVIKVTSSSFFTDILSLPVHPVLHLHKAFTRSELFITLKQCVM